MRPYQDYISLARSLNIAIYWLVFLLILFFEPPHKRRRCCFRKLDGLHFRLNFCQLIAFLSNNFSWRRLLICLKHRFFYWRWFQVFQNFESPFIQIRILGYSGFNCISILLLKRQPFLQPIDMHFAKSFPGVNFLLFLTMQWMNIEEISRSFRYLMLFVWIVINLASIIFLFLLISWDKFSNLCSNWLYFFVF
jgi:hypothetical protein